MKKIISVLLILVIASGILFAAGDKESGSAVYGISISTLNNPFFVSLKEGAEKKANMLGVTLIVVDSQNDPAKEAVNIEDLIQQEVAAILINPTDSDAVVPSVMKANAAGIPVFTIDRGASDGKVVSHIASDNVSGGKMAAEFLIQAIEGSGNVVELEGIAGTSAARDRGAGFNEIVNANQSVKIVAQQTADFNRAKGLSVFENILQAQPKINGVFAHNDEMILGAIEAAKAAGRKGIVFVGFDAVDDAVAAVESGDLSATVAQQPMLIGSLGVESAYKHLMGEVVSENVPVELTLIKQ